MLISKWINTFISNRGTCILINNDVCIKWKKSQTASHMSVVIKKKNAPYFSTLNTQLMKFDYIKICESADTNCLNEFKCKVIKFLSSTRFT